MIWDIENVIIIVEKWVIRLKRQGVCQKAVVTSLQLYMVHMIVHRFGRYRDFVLSPKWYGKIFIRLYYTLSPTIVKTFGKTKFFNLFWKHILDKMVSDLNKHGIDNSPYKDK